MRRDDESWVEATTRGLQHSAVPTCEQAPRRNTVLRDFMPLLAKHSKSFPLIGCIAVGVDSRRQRNRENSGRAVSPIRNITPLESFDRSELSPASKNHREALSPSITRSDIGFRLRTVLRNAATAITHTSVTAAAIQRAKVMVEAMNSTAMNVPTAKAATRKPCSHILKRPSRDGGSVFCA